eukprot:COSAG04_NODE_1420_length_6837_cov_13.629564_5_plen_67_part_00
MRSGVSFTRSNNAAAAAACSLRRTGSGVAVVVISVVLHRLLAGGLLQWAGMLAEEHLRLHLRARPA